MEEYLVEIEVKSGDDPMMFTDYLYGDSFGLRIAANEAQKLLTRQNDASGIVVYLSRNDTLVTLWDVPITQETNVLELLLGLDIAKHVKKGMHESKRTDTHGGYSNSTVRQLTA